MSSWIAKLPERWERKTPFVAYQLIIWHDAETSADEWILYGNIEEAISVMRIRTSDDDSIAMATIRQETIYKRNKRCELSISSPLIHYEKGKGVRL